MKPARTLGIFAPGSPPAAGPLEAGLARLREAGFRIRLGRTAVAAEGLHAGTPEARAADLHELLADPGVDAILCARGGSGALGLLPLLDYALAARAGKPLIGLSDVTALHLALLARSGRPGVAAPVLTQLASLPDYSWERWLEAAAGPLPAGPVPLPAGLAPRRLEGTPAVPAEGLLLPCNLSLLASLIGTPYLPPLDGAILLLEDVHETPQSLDRMVSSLRLSGLDAGLAAVVLGQFTDCRPRNPGVTEEEGRRVVHAWARSLGVPVLVDFPFGHDPLCCALPFGAVARLAVGPPALELAAPPA